jgi:hypothetical protein
LKKKVTSVAKKVQNNNKPSISVAGIIAQFMENDTQQ